MQTNSGNFSRAGLYSVAKKYLPGANLEKAPFNKQENTESAVFNELKYNGEFHGDIGYEAAAFFNSIRAYLLKIIDFFKLLKNVVNIFG